MRKTFAFFALVLLTGASHAADPVPAEVVVDRLDETGERVSQVGAYVVGLEEGKTVPIKVENVSTYPMLITGNRLEREARDSFDVACHDPRNALRYKSLITLTAPSDGAGSVATQTDWCTRDSGYQTTETAPEVVRFGEPTAVYYQISHHRFRVTVNYLSRQP